MLVCEESVISIDNYKLGKEKGSEKKKSLLFCFWILEEKIVLQILSSQSVSGHLSGIWGGFQRVLELRYLANSIYKLYVT